MRSIWKGSISFGLIYIPIRVYAATEDRSIQFNQLHRRCGTRVRYQRWCEYCNVVLTPDDIVRAYAWAPDQYVAVDEADLSQLPLPTTKTVAITEFVRLDSIDPIWFDRTYFLEPIEGGARAYHLLREAMRRSGRAALAKVALRAKESLACVRVFGDRVLALATMHYPDEIRNPGALSGLSQAPAAEQRELALALDLVDRLTDEFQPAKYEDRYRKALLELIEAKVRGQEVTVPPPPVEQPTLDLMAALRASLEKAAAGNGVRAPGPQ